LAQVEEWELGLVVLGSLAVGVVKLVVWALACHLA
jgi:hypothetical protein